MFTRIVVAAAAAAALSNTPATAQVRGPEVPEEFRARQLPQQHLAGPRFGLTMFTGDIARYRDQSGLNPVMSQFGWQFENQLVSTTEGNQALMEWVFLLGGIEERQKNFSMAWLAGLRSATGMELGVGPNFSVNSEVGEINTSLVVAGGMSMPFGELTIPLNVAVAFADGGPRVTALVGWIVGTGTR
ncbi:MAG: hypothetical protein OEZ65_04925 [Gemmatimonadota bacterium]|nr:hypothetical protein [Gemmatimonadota bacterium]MDH5758910.1 hypothetical protein [Gemmatimonadota bacterium]